MKLLITGGGFIGLTVIRHIFNNTDHSVVNVDKLTYAGNLESLTSVESDSKYVFEQVDICNAEIKRVLSLPLHMDSDKSQRFIVTWSIRKLLRTILLFLQGKTRLLNIKAVVIAIYHFKCWNVIRYNDNGYNPFS